MSHASFLFVPLAVYISKPRISFSIYKEGDGYHGNVTCWSSVGSPPANFCLSVDDKEAGCFIAAESLVAWFSVPIVPGLHKAVARCRVHTEAQELMSEPVTLGVGMSCRDVKEMCRPVTICSFTL